MRAVMVSAPDAPENMRVVELPDPVPGEGQVVVEVAYCGCNWADTMVRRGTYPHPLNYPLVPGVEIAGHVAATGPGVDGVEAGTRVAAYVETAGGYAQACRVRKEALITLPDGVPLDVGAAFPVQALTAYHMLHTIGQTKAGDVVLVHAIGGGVGLYCTQLAARAGARVIGTVGTRGKERKPLAFGAERVVNTEDEDFVAVVLRMTANKGVDLALDSLGAVTLDRTFEIVRKLGKVVSFGEAEGQPFKNIRERLLPSSLTFTRFHLGHVDLESREWKVGVEYVLSGIAAGWLRVPIERTYPIDQAGEMHARLESRQVAGKLLLSLQPANR